MNKHVVGNFFRDRAAVIGLFLLNSAVLILFFNIEEGTRKEVLYPLVLSGFLLVVLILLEWLKYYRFNANLIKLKGSFWQDLMPVTAEQRAVNNRMNEVFKRCAADISKLSTRHKERSYLLSQWIHSLKTPISIIDLVIQKCSLEDKDPFEAIESIRQENMRLHSSIEQILTILRLEEFQKDFEPEGIDLVDCVKKLLHSRKRQFILTNVFPELKHEGEKMFVLSDKKWNELMLEQVISNAIKYSREDGKTKKIHIQLLHREEHTILSIRDEGIGIPSYDIGRVFEPFFTGENGRVFRDSTGIGLYISSEIAKRLGHEIRIRSELYEGTEVTFKYITKL